MFRIVFFIGRHKMELLTMPQSIYGEYRPALEQAQSYLMSEMDQVRAQMMREDGFDIVDHCLTRLKTEESMREKCRRNNLPETPYSAVEELRDAVGIRVVCAFLNDVYAIRDHLVNLPNVEVVKEKDYIRHAKPNGYRSYHLILKLQTPGGITTLEDPVPHVYAEIQLRTISMDTWAALEHHLYYKKGAIENEELIASELKRCADELASTDISMQTIREMIES